MKPELDGQDSPTPKEDSVYDYLLNLLSTSFLPKQNYSLDQPLESDTFQDHIKKCEITLNNAISVLEKQRDNTSLNKKLVINIVLLCGEHMRHELWTSPQTVIYAEKLLQLVLAQCNLPSVRTLLIHYKIDHIFTELRPKLLKNTWKDHPAAVSCFIWIISQIKCPDLGDILNSVLPMCLLLVDDHEYSNKIKGLQCLKHIAINVSRAELDQFGRGAVIYSAVEHMIYLREPEIIPPLAACLTALLGKTERRSTTDTLTWSHFDDVLNIWLPSMEMEQKLSLREAYIDSLDSLLQAMGIASLRWSQKLLGILSEYCEQDHTREKALLNLLTFMKTTWPRLSSNFQQIVTILMKVAIRMSKSSASEDSSQSESTLRSIRQCFTLLETICTDKFSVFVCEMRNCTDLKDCFSMITGG